MSNICAVCLVGSNDPVSAALFAIGSRFAAGNAIYHLASPTAKAQRGYGGSDRFSGATGTGTIFKLPNPYRGVIADNNTNYDGNIYPPPYLPSGL